MEEQEKKEQQEEERLCKCGHGPMLHVLGRGRLTDRSCENCGKDKCPGYSPK